MRLSSSALLLFLGWISACEQQTREPESAPRSERSENSEIHESPDPEPSASSAPRPACLIELPKTAPPVARSLAECPADPQGRPTMPEGALSFPEAPRAPRLRVELAQNDADRAHGLMFRSSLSDDEGMLFSWPQSEPRSFWMHNTCLALDMLFLDRDGIIVGVLEQVPPWNDAPRRVPCPAAHVLEVRAGWTRDHGVRPGQRVRFDPSTPGETP